MNILVWGGGGREHAIAWALAKSPKTDELYAVSYTHLLAVHLGLAFALPCGNGRFQHPLRKQQASVFARVLFLLRARLLVTQLELVKVPQVNRLRQLLLQLAVAPVQSLARLEKAGTCLLYTSRCV